METKYSLHYLQPMLTMLALITTVYGKNHFTKVNKNESIIILKCIFYIPFAILLLVIQDVENDFNWK